MTETATPAQLVDAYVDQLRQSLSSAEPMDREEIVDAVREHLRDALGALGHKPSAAEVEAALRELGPVEGVARAWAEGAGLSSPWSWRSSRCWPSWPTRCWSRCRCNCAC
jgi:hypothetical protein